MNQKKLNDLIVKAIITLIAILLIKSCITIHNKTGVKTLKEFVAKTRANPGQYTYGLSGIGSTHHLTMEAIKAELNLDIRHVPFRIS